MASDLTSVGPQKPLGYLPLSELEDPKGLARLLASRGIDVLILDERESNVGSGAMVAYDRRALDKLLKSRKHTLDKWRWPHDVDSFVKYHMTHNAPFRTDLYDLIADAYGDYSNPNRGDLKGALKVAMRYVRFGMLNRFYSHLL